MTDTSRTQTTVVRETTIGTTPGTPRMRAAQITGNNLRYEPEYQMSGVLRPDRMDADPVKVGEFNDGTLTFELAYPRDLWPMSEFIRSLFHAGWTNTPQHDNDGTADSAVTAVGSGTGVFTLTDQSGSGGFIASQYKAGHLVRTTGFTAAANNALARVTASDSTTVTTDLSASVSDSAPAAAARVKVVGLQGASGDITATATGLGSTSLDFTTLGLAVGQWVYVGGSGAAYQFATAACKGWARITAIAATALTLDNLPAGWTTDSGTSKTIRVWFGDRILNGTTEYAVSIETGDLGQATPTYILQAGMHATTMEIRSESGQKITGSIGFEGMSGAESTTSIDASPDAAPDPASYPIFASGANVARVSEAGSVLASPNFVRRLNWSWTNNARSQKAIDRLGASGVGTGRATLGLSLETYFGSRALYTKAVQGTPSSISQIMVKGTQAMVLAAPRVTFRGFPTAPGPDQDKVLSLTGMVSYDSTTGAHYTMDRLEYLDAA